MDPALDRFRVAVEEGQVHHDGDEALARHVTNARFREGRAGHMLEEQAGRPITACVAAVMALEAEETMPDPGAVPPVMIEWVSWPR
jgi:phage terminase large subunit-like protein